MSPKQVISSIIESLVEAASVVSSFNRRPDDDVFITDALEAIEFKESLKVKFFDFFYRNRKEFEVFFFQVEIY